MSDVEKEFDPYEGRTRVQYLKDLSYDYDVPFDHVVALADVLGPNEDFDGLISSLEDFESMYEDMF